jgi:hypothetical protein
MSNNKTTCVHDRCSLETRTLFETDRGSPSGLVVCEHHIHERSIVDTTPFGGDSVNI